MKSPHPASSFHSSPRTATRLLAGLMLCGLPAVVPAQNADSPSQVIDHFHGVVINSVDKRPIARALVTTNDQRMAVMTDSEGRFGFDVRRPVATSTSNGDLITSFPGLGGITQGVSVFLTVRRPGYLSLTSATRVPADPQSAPEEIQLKLVPESIVRGHLSVSSGAIPPGAQVQLYRKQVQEGAALWAQAGAAQVNGRGDYRFADLPAGDYKIMARASNEGGNSPHASDESTGYAPSYYADASDLASTPPLHLGAGETVQADLNLRASTFYHVEVPVPNAPRGVGINTTVGNQDELSGLFLAFNAQTQMLDGYLPNGTYDIRVFSYGQPPSSGRGRIEVAGKAVKAPPITLVPNGQIPVIVYQQYTMTDDTQQAPGLNSIPNQSRRSLDISLRPLALQANGASLKNVPNQGDDNLVLDNVQEGTYRVVARPYHGYIASMSADGVDLLRQPLVVGPGGASGPIEITLRDDSATLSGTISVPNPLPSSSSSSTGNLLGPGIYLITCIPLGDGSAAAPLQAVAFNGGKFTIPNLPPGDYLVLASSNSMMNIEYQNPDVLRQYQLKGTTITLAPGQKAQIQVTPLPESDTEPEN